jgi:hypothetical protein
MTTTTAPELRTFPAVDLKPGDVITFDFAGGPNRLGEVEVFDAYPIGAGLGHRQPMTQLVLLHPDRGYCYRQVASATTFAVR